MFDTISTVRLLFMQQDTLQKKRGSTDFHLSHEGRAPEAVPPMRLLDRSNLQRTIRSLGSIPSNIERNYHYREESLLLIGLLRTLWRLSYQDMYDWLKSWQTLALACGLPLNKQGQPRIPSKSQQCKRRHAAGAPLHESLFVLTVLQALQSRLIGARDLIIDSAPILAVSAAMILLLPSDTLQLTILLLFFEASGCIPSFVVVLAYRSSFCSLPLIHMMLLLHKGCWHGLYTFIRSIPVSSAWMSLIGACV